MKMNIRVTLLPAAHAVLHGASFRLMPDHPLGSSAQVGDLVELAGCQADFVVCGRKWTIGGATDFLELTLDLAFSEPALTAVTAPR